MSNTGTNVTTICSDDASDANAAIINKCAGVVGFGFNMQYIAVFTNIYINLIKKTI